ncbi:hypothetical protein BK026_05175 [Alteromonas sp. V450]|uniref:DsrH/TusB family sulfur metabolism protein n=1 Tax=Alteromonas sp. V450 TaxID=1912139 RepID=UPI0008FF4CB8|nr:DsrH/TusB family sulfur metabolism protein [Alteromonas sp. V450]OJF68220.1 hypothetical protein BK026_05175 [Alteromonas sp. V450]
MLITISTPHLSATDKQFLTAAFEQTTSDIRVIFNGDGVYAPTLNGTFFDTLAHLEENESAQRFAYVSSDAVTRGACIPEHITPISYSEFAAISTKHKHWVSLS